MKKVRSNLMAKVSAFTPSRRKQAGDAMIAYSIAAVLLAIAAIAIFKNARDNSRKNDISVAVSKVAATAGNLQASLGANNRYEELTTDMAVRMEWIPVDQRNVGTGTASNVYGGAVTTVPKTLTATNDAASLSWGLVPTSQCGDIVMGTYRLARQVIVGATTVKALDGALNTASLSTACDVAAPVTIVWDFGRTGSTT
ncbi:type 4 pilus major pilin [Janthinobacterium sp. MDT1-19]|uniref:type 4 pilus major pilin n=1 Tax=Janthinobacterium sp. MDT1-19 TaxID=1259339 RepID=UPI003F1E63CD